MVVSAARPPIINITLDTNSPALPDLEAAAAEALDTILADPALAEAGWQTVSESPPPPRSGSGGGLVSCAERGGRYWTRTSDFLGVSEAL